MRLLIAAAAVATAGSLAAPRAAEPRWPIQEFLTKYAHATAAELQALERGEPVARSIEIGDVREVAVAGAIRLPVSRATFVDKYRDIAKIKESDAVVQIGKFSAVPTAEDISPLVLEKDDLSTLARCRLGDCDMRLTAPMIERFRKEIDWKAPDHDARATALMHEILAQRAADFLAKGDGALVRFADQSRPVDPAASFAAILSHEPSLEEYAPELREYLVKFPEATLPDTDGFTYWSKEVWGPVQVISLTNVTIYPRPASRETLIATRDIYANHVLDASLGILVVADVSEHCCERSCLLMYLNHSKVDALHGMLSALRRSFVQRRQRENMANYLKATREKIGR